MAATDTHDSAEEEQIETLLYLLEEDPEARVFRTSNSRSVRRQMLPLDENDVIASIRALEKEYDEEEDNERTEFCFCNGPDVGFMIACDGGCEEWFHGACIKIKEKNRDRLVSYFCPDCTRDGRGKTTWKDDRATVVDRGTPSTNTDKRTTAKRKAALEIDTKLANKHRRQDSATPGIASGSTFNGDDPTPRTLRTPRQRKRANMRASRLHDRAMQANVLRVSRQQSALSAGSSQTYDEQGMSNDDDGITIASSARIGHFLPKATATGNSDEVAQHRISLMEWSQRPDLHYYGSLTASDEHGLRPQQSPAPSSSTMGELLEEEDEQKMRASNQKHPAQRPL